MAGEVLSVEEARALVTTSLSDASLEDVIVREEAFLRRRIGPLTGLRTETFVSSIGDETLELYRRTGSVVVVDDVGDVTDLALRGWSDVVRTSGSWNGAPIVTYEPSDEDEIRKALIDLVRLAVTESGYAQEAAGGYSAVSDVNARRAVRWTSWKSLLRPPAPSSTRLGSPLVTEGRRISGVVIEIPGS